MTVVDGLHNLFKYPLFGRDSSPEYTAPRLSVLGTIIFWLIFLICGLFIHPTKQQKFETVQIVLESTPIEPTEKKEVLEKSNTEVAKTNSEVEPAKPTQEVIKETPTQVAQPKTEAPKPVEQAPAKTETKKVETPKTETQSYTKAPAFVPKKTVEEQMAEQLEARQANSKSYDNDPFARFLDDPIEENVTQNAQIQHQIDNKAALSGSAGSAATSKTSSSTTSSTTTSSSTESKTASSSTTSSLGKIAATSYSSKSSDGTSESVALVKSARTSEGKVTVAMDDGTNRALIYPSKPVINISDENAKLIDSTKTVKISFSVAPAGNVPKTLISITPATILPTAVQNEVLDQISEWRFETSSSSSTAQFEFTILIK